VELSEYLDCYCSLFLDFSGLEYVEELFGCFSTEAKVHFTHGSLSPITLCLKAPKIAAIVDID